MANLKAVDVDKLDADLTSVANAIRAKGETSGSLAFPNGFVNAVNNIEATEVVEPNIEPITIKENGVYQTEGDIDGYAPITVDIDIPTPVIEALEVTENGTYNTPQGVDGFDPVVVDVEIPTPVITPITIKENGEYVAPDGVDGHSPIKVEVPIPAPVEPNIESLTITENGTYTAPDGIDGYSPISVEVAPYGEGDIEITANGTHDVSGKATAIVNVASSGGDDVLKGIIEHSATEVVIPEGTTMIGDYVFYNMRQLAKIHIPQSVTSVGSSAFQICNELTEVYIEDVNTYCRITSMNGSSSTPFYASKKARAYTYEGEEIKSITFPQVATIGNFLFQYCLSIESVIFPNECKVIKTAFAYCPNLKTAVFNGATSLESGCFAQCTNLELEKLPETITSIKSSAFNSCSKITISEIPSGVTDIANYAFRNCTGLTSLTFKGIPTSINAGAFDSCTNLNTINVPWAEGAVQNAPWGATNATINYNYVEGE
jgi:hypothetical protein